MSYNRNNDYSSGYNHGYSSKSGQANNPCADVSGGCARNGMEGASSRYSVNWGNQHHPDNVYNAPLSGRQTNNRADLRAAETAISTARDRGYDQVTVRTNSDYVIKGHTQWMDNWQQNGWKKANGGEVKNREDFIRLNDASQGMQVNYEKVGNRGKKY